MKTKVLNPEVVVADDSLVYISERELDLLKDLALRNPRKRIRLCAHTNVEDQLHEMLIIHTRGAYVRPHKHIGKTESLHIIEGEADLVVFSDEGVVSTVFPMGGTGSGRCLYCRLADSFYHTLLIHSDFLVFHETTNGPFRREQTVFPLWAPDETNPAAVGQYQEKLVYESGHWATENQGREKR